MICDFGPKYFFTAPSTVSQREAQNLFYMALLHMVCHKAKREEKFAMIGTLNDILWVITGRKSWSGVGGNKLEQKEQAGTAINSKLIHVTQKTGCKIFVIVLPKEGLAGTSPPRPSFGMTPTIK